jgi:hypothetical protein
MRKVALACLIAISVPLGSTPVQAHVFEGCREQRRRVSELKKDHATCDRARKVARRYDERRVESGQFPGGRERIGRFNCVSERTGYETWHVKCRRGNDEHPSRVRFNWGV